MRYFGGIIIPENNLKISKISIIKWNSVVQLEVVSFASAYFAIVVCSRVSAAKFFLGILYDLTVWECSVCASAPLVGHRDAAY